MAEENLQDFSTSEIVKLQNDKIKSNHLLFISFLL
jgi:hypothetical protein